MPTTVEQLNLFKKAIETLPEQERSLFIEQYEGSSIENQEQLVDKVSSLYAPSEQEPPEEKDVRGLFGDIPAEEFMQGRRNVMGQLTRPAAGSREFFRALAGQGREGESTLEAATRGFKRPHTSEMFTEQFIRESQASPELERVLKQRKGAFALGTPKGHALSKLDYFIEGLPGGVVGMVLDAATDPLTVATYTAGTLFGARIANSKFGQQVGQIMSRERHWSNVGRNLVNLKNRLMTVSRRVSKHLPKKFNRRWFMNEAKNVRATANSLKGSLNNSFESVRSPFYDVKVNASQVDDLFLNSNLDDATIALTDRLGRIDTVEKAYAAHNIIKGKAGRTVFTPRGTTGIGGKQAPRIVQKDTARALKDIIYKVIGKEKGIDDANTLKALDSYAADKVYPAIDKLHRMVGGAPLAEPGQVSGTYAITPRFGMRLPTGGDISKASNIEALKRLGTQAAKGLKRFTAKEYTRQLRDTIYKTELLGKNLTKYRVRQYGKIGLGVGAYMLYKGMTKSKPQIGRGGDELIFGTEGGGL